VDIDERTLFRKLQAKLEDGLVDEFAAGYLPEKRLVQFFLARQSLKC
jgi:hypothetical protein